MSLTIPTMAAIRFGYGIRPGETPVASVGDLLAQVDKGARQTPSFPREGIEQRRATYTRLTEEQAEIFRLRRSGQVEPERQKAVQAARQAAYQADSMARIADAVLSPYGFYQRLAGFWSNHFAVSAGKLPAMRLMVSLYEAEAIRPNVGGSFSDLLHAAALHPAMLIYLDQVRSVGPNSPAGQEKGKGLNENLARELMELHTLGVDGGYSQADVRSAALLLTGLGIKKPEQVTTFHRRRAEPGPITVRGKVYGDPRRSIEECRELLDDLAADPHTARHVCTKLAAHFIADTPPQEVVAAMTDAWAASDGELMAVYRAMLEHPRAWIDEGAKIKTPFEFVVSGLRALDVDGDMLAAMVASVGAGEPAAGDAAAMMAEPGMASAMSSAMSMGADQPQPDAAEDPAETVAAKALRQARPLTINAVARMGQATWQPSSPKGFPDDASSWLTAGQLAERISWARRAVSLFGEDEDPRAFLRATLADAARDDTIQVVSQAPSKQHGLTMVLASPEFNRR